MLKLGASVALVALAFGGTAASAATVTYTGSGAFSHFGDCNGCSTSHNGTELDMSGFNNSTLTAQTVNNSFALTSPRNDVTIGELVWVNNASSGSDQNFDVTYTFSLNFTSPSNSSDTQAFTLDITQPTNPPGDNVFDLSNATLAGLGPFTLNGVTISDLHFALASGSSGTYDSSTGHWADPEDRTSTLLIEADFAPTATPLPAALPMFAGGLGMVGFLARRKKRKAAAAV